MTTSQDKVAIAFAQIKANFELDNRNLGPSDLISVALALIPLVETMCGKGNGPAKKHIVLSVLRQCIREFVPGSTNRMLLAVDEIVSPAIDGFIDVAKGRVKLHKSVKSCCNVS